MKIQHIKDLASVLHKLNKNEAQPIIESSGLSKFKNQVFKLSQHIDKNITETYNSSEIELFKVLQNFSKVERKSLINSMLTSYFTPDHITRAISESFINYIKGKTDKIEILEPSSGTGNFINAILNNSNYSNIDWNIDAIEKDIITARILQNNYNDHSNVSVFQKGFEDFKLTKKYDLIIGNVPFGNFGVYDSDTHKEYNHLYQNRIHNYFFVKSSLALKPGGVMGLLTTASMSDLSANRSLREYLVNENNLISLIRLPNNTFKESATSVVSDLLIFQKPLSKKETLSPSELEFIESGKFQEQYPINTYLLNNTNSILGDIQETTGYAGKNVITVNDSNSFNLEEKYQIIYDHLSDDLKTKGLEKLLDISIENEEDHSDKLKIAKEDHQQIISSYPNAVPGNLIYDSKTNEFKKVIVHPDYIQFFSSQKTNISISKRERLYMILEIRDLYKNFLLNIREQNLDQTIHFQEQLNDKYDQFSFMYTELHQKVNFDLLKKEEERDIILGLEIFKNDQYQKADIFSKVFEFSPSITSEPKSLDHAIIDSLNDYGGINYDMITAAVNQPFLEWAEIALKREILYLNPIIVNRSEIEKFELVPPSEFLSGFIESKIKIYKNKRFENSGQFSSLLNKSLIDASTKALYDYVPLKLSIEDINPDLGENWVPNEIYTLFGREHFDDNKFQIKFYPGLDRFKIYGGHSSSADARYGVKKDWGSVSYLNVFRYAMEHNVPAFTKTVYDLDGKERKIVDKKTINSVTLSVENLNKAFTEWLFSKKDICEKLEDKYHYLYNADVKRKYSSKDLKFDDLQTFDPYDHQKECTIQIVQQNGGIIDHEVGFGKSVTMPMITMTKIKFKLIKKELVAGLNANYVDLYNTYKMAYPTGNFLLVTPKDIGPDKKQETFYKIANNNWDAVITAHSCLSKFPRAPYTEADIYEEMIKEVENTLDDPESKEILSRREIGQLEKKLNNAKAKFQSATTIINSKKENGLLIFEDLGFDSLTIDESQFFKNLTFNTRHNRVAGLGTTADTQKTSNLLSYVRSIQGIHKSDKGITFASGTTISNSITELYHIFRYLRPQELFDKGIHCFDQWGRLYARKTSEYEESVGGDIKLKERFRYFVKAPELAKFYNDIAHYSDFNTFKIERPEAVTEFITIDPYPVQSNYFKAIQQFSKTKNPNNLIGVGNGDNIKKAAGLICTNQGRKASLDMRLIHSKFGDHPNNKINTMISKAVPLYEKFTSDKGTQLIFCDQGTPTGRNFNLYQAIKDNLIDKGIPENEIAFIHSYDRKRKTLYEMINNGDIRFLIGSTSKMGVGVNVQKRLVAMHHLDFPWRPTDLSQRNGRGERTGNIVLPKYDNCIKVFYYGVKNSLDAYTFNLLHIKDRFIKQLKNASLSTRTLDEGIIGSDGHVNLEDFQALCSPNQLLTEKLKLERKLYNFLDKEKAFFDNRKKNTNSLSMLTIDRKQYEKTIKQLKSDKATALPLFNAFNDKNYTIQIDNKKYVNDKKAGTHLHKILNEFFKKKIKSKNEILCDLSNGFTLNILPKFSDFNEKIQKDNYKIVLQTPNNVKIGYKSAILTKNIKEAAMYPYQCLERINELIESYDIKIKEADEQLEILNEIVDEQFSEKDEIKMLQKEIKNLEVEIEKEQKNETINEKSSEKNNTKSL